MSIVSDSTPMEDPKDPDKCNIFALYKLFATPAEVEEMAARYRAGNYGYGHAKQALFEKMQEHFAPMQERRNELAKDIDTVWDILREGGRRASAEADKTMEKVRCAVGLR
jgi:tryptophanyl-tRNA synthetase